MLSVASSPLLLSLIWVAARKKEQEVLDFEHKISTVIEESTTDIASGHVEVSDIDRAG